MIYFGNSVTNTTEELRDMSLDELRQSIAQPSDEFVSKIRQLRGIMSVDARHYANLKKTLPFFVCAKFYPSFRKKDNFSYAEYFIIDIDHLSQKNLQIDEVRQMIQADSRVVMCFVSPSGDGLKVMFHLQERCTDINIYSQFYKVFIQKFSEKYHLNQVIDSVTNDVSRACFMSYDPNVYYNPKADFVDYKAFVSTENIGLFLQEQKEIEKTIKNQIGSSDTTATVSSEPDKNEFEDIKKRLGMLQSPHERYKQKVIVLETLQTSWQRVKTKILDTGIEVKSERNIDYGVQVRFCYEGKFAELNIYYSPKNCKFSIVKANKNDLNQELNEIMYETVERLIYS